MKKYLSHLKLLSFLAAVFCFAAVAGHYSAKGAQAGLLGNTSLTFRTPVTVTVVGARRTGRSCPGGGSPKCVQCYGSSCVDACSGYMYCYVGQVSCVGHYACASATLLTVGGFDDGQYGSSITPW